MGKAILRIDAPESCAECKFKCGGTCEIAKCYGVPYHDNNVLPYYEIRATFCPLEIEGEAEESEIHKKRVHLTNLAVYLMYEQKTHLCSRIADSELDYVIGHLEPIVELMKKKTEAGK